MGYLQLTSHYILHITFNNAKIYIDDIIPTKANQWESTGSKIMGVAIKQNEFTLPVTMKINNLNICTHIGN